MKQNLILSGLLIFSSISVFAQDYFDDDIYYNPAKSQNTKKEKKQSNYISNMAERDVDDYNRRGAYYATPIDTIGSYVENGEDFIYTQQIQKYYNPTIVVDNANVLGDVLSNSYGNVEIVINDNGLPVFTPYYAYNWPYYNGWGFNFGSWGWNLSFYDPWYSWDWGPAWSWGPSWSWGWGPSWAWGPSWGWGPGWGGPVRPGWGPNPPMASWRPNGNRPVAPGSGWSGGHRPGVSTGGGIASSGHRPVVGTSSQRPGTGTSRPNSGVVNNNGIWEYVNGGHRVPAGTLNQGSHTGNNNGTVRPGNTGNSQNNSNRVTTGRNNSNTNSNYNSNRNNSNYNSTRNSNSSNRSFNTGRSNSGNRSTGGFSGGRGNTGGRSGGGRHR